MIAEEHDSLQNEDVSGKRSSSTRNARVSPLKVQQRNIESIKKEKKILEELDLDIGNEYTLLGKRDAIEKNLTKMRVEYLKIKETGKNSICAPLKKRTVLDKMGALMNMY